MRLLCTTLLVLAAMVLKAQSDKVLLEVADLGNKMEAPRVSLYPLYTDIYTVSDLAEGFVLGFGRTFAYFDNNMDLKWKKDLPDYVKQPPTAIVMGDNHATYIVDFGPSFVAFKKCQVTQIDNSSGSVVSSTEYSWDTFEKNLLDYNYYNGKLTFLFGDNTAEGPVHKLLTIVDGQAKWATLVIEEGGFYQGDLLSGPHLNLENKYKWVDKENKKVFVVYNTVKVSLEGKVLGEVESVEIDVTALEHSAWHAENSVHAAVAGEERFYFIQYERQTFPQGFLFGKSAIGSTFNEINTHNDKFTNKIVEFPIIKFDYLPQADLFVAQIFYMQQIKQGNVRRIFINKEGKIVWEDDLEVEPNAKTGEIWNRFALTSYKSKLMQRGASTSFPTNLAYFNVIEEFSRRKPEQAIHFIPLKRADGYILIIADPNTGKVTGRKI